MWIYDCSQGQHSLITWFTNQRLEKFMVAVGKKLISRVSIFTIYFFRAKMQLFVHVCVLGGTENYGEEGSKAK